MTDKRVDYDCIAGTYNRRFADEKRSGTSLALQELSDEINAQRILEVGCGTAHWLDELYQTNSRFLLYGLDPSTGMLKQARKRGKPLCLVRGLAERLPFPAQVFDLVYCINALHHFVQPRRFIAEARRVLQSGGSLSVVSMDPRSNRDRWYIYDYFPGTYETDLARFPSWGTVLDWLIIAGFNQVTWRLAEYISKPKIGAAVLDDPHLDKNACSQLALLGYEDYAQGLHQIRGALATAETNGETLIFPCDIELYILTARLPLN